MKNKKNIDNLFKENLQNQEINPPEMVWNNIERELKKKKDKKIIAIWWRYAGAAAILLIGFLLVKDSFLNKDAIVQPIIVNSNKKENNTIINQNNSSVKAIALDNNNDESDVKKEQSAESIFVKQKNDKQLVGNNQIRSNQNTSIQNSEKSEDELVSFVKNKNESIVNKNNSSIANSQQQTTEDETFKKVDLNVKNSKNAILLSEKINNSFRKNETINESLASQESLEKIKKETTITDKNLKKDSTAIKPNVLENLLATKTKKKIKESKPNKWQITPNIAPIFANAIANNSTYNSKFDNNAKTYEKNISLGIAVNYNLSKKISLRTGINKFDVGSDTKNVGFYTNTATFSDATAIVSNEISISNNLEKLPDIFVLNTTGLATSFEQQSNPIQKTDGTINQKNTYIEIPLEVSYKIVNQKVGINLITGFSTIFLNEDRVSLIAATNNIDLGQANNLNKIHYSSNFGLGFSYKFLKSFSVNLEPIIKYQINTFKNESDNNKPYFVGIYSGISYGF